MSFEVISLSGRGDSGVDNVFSDFGRGAAAGLSFRWCGSEPKVGFEASDMVSSLSTGHSDVPNDSKIAPSSQSVDVDSGETYGFSGRYDTIVVIGHWEPEIVDVGQFLLYTNVSMWFKDDQL